MDELWHNLISGQSYLTQDSDDPEHDGEILYYNITSVAERLFGEDYSDDDFEYLMEMLGAESAPWYRPNNTDEIIRSIDTIAKARGGAGWL